MDILGLSLIKQEDGQMRRVQIHLGGPKCASTSIQSALAKEKKIAYIGFRPDLAPINWFKNKSFQRLLDLDLKYSSRDHFNNELPKYRKLILEFKDENRARDIWISSENLISRFTLEELDVSEKLQRVSQVFEGVPIELHILFRTYESAIRSMYYEYVTRKYNRSLSHFLTELDEFMTMGIIDHMLPAKIIRNIQYGMNENANFNINFYLPENGLVKKELPCIERMSEYCKVNLNLQKINASDYDFDKMVMLNRSYYNEKNLHNFMELHRYKLAKYRTISDDDLKERKIRRSIMESVGPADINIQLINSQIRRSSFFQNIILKEHKEFMSMLNHCTRSIKMFGSPDALLNTISN